MTYFYISLAVYFLLILGYAIYEQWSRDIAELKALRSETARLMIIQHKKFSAMMVQFDHMITWDAWLRDSKDPKFLEKLQLMGASKIGEKMLKDGLISVDTKIPEHIQAIPLNRLHLDDRDNVRIQMRARVYKEIKN